MKNPNSPNYALNFIQGQKRPNQLLEILVYPCYNTHAQTSKYSQVALTASRQFNG